MNLGYVMTPDQISAAADLAPLINYLSAHGPWVVFGALIIRGVHTWTKHLCELAPRVLDVMEGVQKDGVKIRVTIDPDEDKRE